MFLTGILYIDLKNKSGKIIGHSILYMTSQEPVIIEPNGIYNPVLGVFIKGSFFDFAKLRTSLPFDYISTGN